MARSEILVGVEVGTNKVCFVVAESQSDQDLHILGVGMVSSKGVRKGEIIDLETATVCVHDALRQAETNCGVGIQEVSVAVTGGHVGSFNSRGAVTIPKERLEIEEQDLNEVAIKAKEVSLPAESTFLHSIVQHYYVDGAAGVINPVGMVGRRLEAEFHIIHGMRTRLQNTLRVIDDCGLQIRHVVVNSLASSQAVLDEDQKDLGVLLLDIGGGVTDWIVYVDGLIKASGVLAVGGDHISNDISLGLRIPLTRAEKLKVEEGSALCGVGKPGEVIVLKNDAGFSGREIEREMLNLIINARVKEIFNLVRKSVEKEVELERLRTGVLLTGGCSLLPGICEIASSVFEVPAHQAHETKAAGPKSLLSNPQLSTAIGVVKFAQDRLMEEQPTSFWEWIFGRLLGKR